MLLVPVTGLAAINAIGRTRSEIISHLRKSQSGLQPSEDLPTNSDLGTVRGDLPELPRELDAYQTRLAQLLAYLLGQLEGPLTRARARWRPERIGVFLGTSTAGAATTEAAYAHYLKSGALPPEYDYEKQHTFGATLQVVRHLTGAEGPGWVVSTACTSSAKTVGTARRLMSTDIIDAAIVGGVDTLCAMTVRGFGSLGALAEGRCRPFSTYASGINIGEGGALALLERSGDAEVLVEGVGESSDSYHVSAPHPDGLGAELAMRRSFPPGVTKEDIDHVNAHGTGTVHNDGMESKAIRNLLGPHVPVVSTKSYTGHTLGGAGSTELALATWMMQDGFLASSLGADPVHPDYGIEVVDRLRTAKLNRVLSNSFAFGGNNITLCLRSP